MKDWKKELFTIPNLLSLFRLLLIPVYVTLYLNAKENTDFFLAAAILAVSCLTDLVDGKIARHFNMVSTVGKVLDPLADKATQFSLILCLAVKYPVLRFLVCIFFIKEIFQLVAGVITFRRGRMLKGALITGKISTTVLFVSLILMVMLPQLSYDAVVWITVLDTIFLTISFVDYILTYMFSSKRFQILDEN